MDTSSKNIKIAKCMGFDYGKRRIGVAIGQRLTNQAEPLITISAKKGVPNWIAIDKIMHDWQPSLLVVGLPLNMDGTEQNMTKHARTFRENLLQRYQIPVEMVDERLTSYVAKKNLSEQDTLNTSVDAESARIILQDWLDNSG